MRIGGGGGPGRSRPPASRKRMRGLTCPFRTIPFPPPRGRREATSGARAAGARTGIDPPSGCLSEAPRGLSMRTGIPRCQSIHTRPACPRSPASPCNRRRGASLRAPRPAQARRPGARPPRPGGRCRRGPGPARPPSRTAARPPATGPTGARSPRRHRRRRTRPSSTGAAGRARRRGRGARYTEVVHTRTSRCRAARGFPRLDGPVRPGLEERVRGHRFPEAGGRRRADDRRRRGGAPARYTGRDDASPPCAPG